MKDRKWKNMAAQTTEMRFAKLKNAVNSLCKE